MGECWMQRSVFLLLLLLQCGSALGDDPKSECEDWKSTLPERSILACSQLIGSEPEVAWAYINRGLAYKAKGEYDRAIADYNKAIELDPSSHLGFQNRAWSYTL